MDRLFSDNYHGNFLMKISSVTHGYSEWMFVPYLTFWNIALIFLAIESCVQVFKIFKEKLDICIVRPRSYCNIVLLNVCFKKLNWYYCTILEYFIFSSPKLKAQVSFSGHLLSIICLSVYPSVHIFEFFSRTIWPISTKPGTKYPWAKGINVCSNEVPSPFPRGQSILERRGVNFHK